MKEDTRKNILLIGSCDKFEKNICECLNFDYFYNVYVRNEIVPDFEDFLIENKTEVIIFNLLTQRKRIGEELKKILKQQLIKKIILLENAKDLYQKNTSLPFSVYKQFLPKSRISKSW